MKSAWCPIIPPASPEQRTLRFAGRAFFLSLALLVACPDAPPEDDADTTQLTDTTGRPHDPFPDLRSPQTTPELRDPATPPTPTRPCHDDTLDGAAAFFLYDWPTPSPLGAPDLQFGLSTPSHSLLIESRTVGPQPVIDTPGTYLLTELPGHAHYDTCSLCVLYQDHEANRIFMATEGVIDIALIDTENHRLSATASELNFIEIEFPDLANRISRPVYGGEERCLNTLEIEDIAECHRDADCGPDRPFCLTDTLKCVACHTSFDCPSSRAPACIDHACTTVDLCQGDDQREHGDDGPSGATLLTLGTEVNGRICGNSADPSGLEADFFRLDLTEPQPLKFTFRHDPAIWLHATLLNDRGDSVTHLQEITHFEPFEPGTYYIRITSLNSGPTNTAQPYQLKVSRVIR